MTEVANEALLTVTCENSNLNINLLTHLILYPLVTLRINNTFRVAISIKETEQPL